MNKPSFWLKQKTIDLLNDWGAFLQADLYRDAVTHLLGGVEAVVRKVNIYSDEQLLGEQEVYLLTASQTLDDLFAWRDGTIPSQGPCWNDPRQ